MLKLEVIHYKGAVPPRVLAAEFGAQGGTIGRADANTLVLPDAERFISRTHARIKFHAGHYVIEDHGSSTPVMVNGRALGRGSEASLAHGDELTIGEYQLRAIVQLVVAPGAEAENVPAGDPMTLFGGASSADPFADLIPRTTPAASAPVNPAAGADPFSVPDNRAQGGIPADFDPFAHPAPSPATPPPAAGVAAPGFGVSPQSQSLDVLFGLGPATGGDPLGGSAAPAAPGTAGPFKGGPSLDPLDAFKAAPAPAAAPTQRNDVPELFGAYVPPRAIRAPEVARPAGPAAEAAPAAAIAAATPAPVEAVASVPEEDAALASTQRVAVVRPGADTLAHAFLEGAGITNFSFPSGLTPQTMNLLGQVLRETVQAMLDLLLARAMLKREMRADVTMIVAQENNPLKFSPNVEAALMHLLSPQRGYMQPLEAVRDACNDLRSNQFAFMAGMRAALTGILQRFNPDHLEQRLKDKSVLDALLPGNRKARMWDLFSALYGDVSREAEDNFHEMFGREFVRAYEAQIAKLSGEGGKGP